MQVVVLGARLEEQEALQTEFEQHADARETAMLEDRLKTANYGGIPAYALNDLHRGGPCISVGVIGCSEMGNVAAAINTAYAIAEYRPSLIIFSGIAGALDSENMRIGDVILPRTIVTRDFNKLKAIAARFEDLRETEKPEALSHVNAKLHTFQRSVDAKRTASCGG